MLTLYQKNYEINSGLSSYKAELQEQLDNLII